MTTLQTIYPDVAELLKLQPEDLAPTLLKLAAAAVRGDVGFVMEAVANEPLHLPSRYPFFKKPEVDRLIDRTWQWIERNDLIERSPGMNGQNGWRWLTEKGQAVADGQDMAKMLEMSTFPKHLLHPLIRDKAVAALTRGSNSSVELVEAVRSAFIILEEEIRKAGRFTASDYGSDLMRAAFHYETGPLRDQDTAKPKGEREAFSHLFAGAYAGFKNPLGHGNPKMDLSEARDQLLLVSLLLRIVDRRRP